LVKISHQDGTVERIPSGDRWQARLQADAPRTPAAVVADLHDKPFGGDPGPLPQPAGLLRRRFAVQKQVRHARAYVTALGAYEMFINGQRLGSYVLTPGFTQFDKRVQYQTYDITNLLENGQNVAAAVFGAGWFGSGISWTAQRFKLDRHRVFWPGLKSNIAMARASRSPLGRNGKRRNPRFFMPKFIPARLTMRALRSRAGKALDLMMPHGHPR
jgi:hypothetical protein